MQRAICRNLRSWSDLGKEYSLKENSLFNTVLKFYAYLTRQIFFSLYNNESKFYAFYDTSVHFEPKRHLKIPFCPSCGMFVPACCLMIFLSSLLIIIILLFVGFSCGAHIIYFECLSFFSARSPRENICTCRYMI